MIADLLTERLRRDPVARLERSLKGVARLAWLKHCADAARREGRFPDARRIARLQAMELDRLRALGMSPRAALAMRDEVRL